MTGALPPDQIDHRNRTRDDNRWDNLRPADNSVNQANVLSYANNTSGFKGVSWCASEGKWRAQLMHRGKRILSKDFISKQEAYAAYCRAARAAFGSYAALTQEGA